MAKQTATATMPLNFYRYLQALQQQQNQREYMQQMAARSREAAAQNEYRQFAMQQAQQPEQVVNKAGDVVKEYDPRAGYLMIDNRGDQRLSSAVGDSSVDLAAKNAAWNRAAAMGIDINSIEGGDQMDQAQLTERALTQQYSPTSRLQGDDLRAFMARQPMPQKDPVQGRMTTFTYNPSHQRNIDELVNQGYSKADAEQMYIQLYANGDRNSLGKTEVFESKQPRQDQQEMLKRQFWNDGRIKNLSPEKAAALYESLFGKTEETARFNEYGKAEKKTGKTLDDQKATQDFLNFSSKQYNQAIPDFKRNYDPKTQTIWRPPIETVDFAGMPSTRQPGAWLPLSQRQYDNIVNMFNEHTGGEVYSDGVRAAAARRAAATGQATAYPFASLVPVKSASAQPFVEDAEQSELAALRQKKAAYESEKRVAQRQAGIPIGTNQITDQTRSVVNSLPSDGSFSLPSDGSFSMPSDSSGSDNLTPSALEVIRGYLNYNN